MAISPEQSVKLTDLDRAFKEHHGVWRQFLAELGKAEGNFWPTIEADGEFRALFDWLGRKGFIEFSFVPPVGPKSGYVTYGEIKGLGERQEFRPLFAFGFNADGVLEHWRDSINHAQFALSFHAAALEKWATAAPPASSSGSNSTRATE